MEYDIIIVGAGPAGLSTGLHLAQLAPELAGRTLILERARHPRPKLCAGGITPGGEAWLKRLGLNLAEVPAVDVWEALFPFEGRGFAVRRRPYVFRIVRRDEFDAWLADAARARGLALQEETAVRGVRCVGERVEVETGHGLYYARAVVGADGATSVVRRAIARDRPSRVARLLEVTLPANLTPRQDGQAIVDFSWIDDGVQGYVWDFPTLFHGQLMCTRGIFDSRIHPAAPRVSLQAIMQDELAAMGLSPAAYELSGHPLRWFHRRGIFSAPRILLVGDAAGVDPLLGEGISFALGYGEIAAQQLRAAFAGGDFSFRDYRARILAHRTGRYLQRRYGVARWIYGIRAHWLLRFLSWRLGFLLGWLAEHFWVDWGT